jgi:hypothetical protein
MAIEKIESDYVSSIARNLMGIRQQRDRIRDLGDALSRGQFDVVLPPTDHLSSPERESLEELKRKINFDANASTFKATSTVASVLDQLATGVIDDVQRSTARIRAMRSYQNAPQKSHGDASNDGSEKKPTANVIDAEFVEIKKDANQTS